MKFQLFFFLDASFDKHVVFEVMALIGKNFLNLMTKQKRKLEGLIDEKLLKLNIKIRQKTNYLLFCIFAYRR